MLVYINLYLTIKKRKVFKPILSFFYYWTVVKAESKCYSSLASETSKMHILQPKHSKLNEKDVEELLQKLNLSKSQLPKILSSDVALPEGCDIGTVVKIERKEGDKTNVYYRVVV